METKHTPGPQCFIHSESGEPWECPEHFRLYRAAPELLDLLISLEEDIADGTFEKREGKNREEYLGMIRSAISAATEKKEGTR